MKILIGICLTLILFSPCLAVSGNNLIENAKTYDGKIIEYQGEVIGDIMARGEYAWLNVNDGSRAIGIWTKKSLVKDIKKTGSYRYIGDEIKVNGVFHRACPQHGGDLDIHAHKIEVIKEGYELQHKIYPAKVIIAVVLLMAILLVVFLPRFLKSSS